MDYDAPDTPEVGLRPEKRCALIVADRPERRERHRFLLRTLRFEPVDATASTALDEAERVHPNIVFIDVEDEAQATVACRRIKWLFEDRVPILLTFAAGGEGPLYQRVAESGADDYVLRPFDEVDLVFKLRRMMNYALQFQSLQEKNARLDSLLRRHVGGPLVEAWLREGNGGVELSGREVEVTTLFADINGFTRLSSEWPAERTVVVLNEILTLCTLPLIDFGGTVDKYIGDCVMAYFGPADEQPEHATRAVRAAVAMQAALHRWATHARDVGDIITLSIGINTGRVILGNMGSSLRLDHTVIGDPVNVAARLQYLAPVGAVLAGPETAAQTACRFRWEPLGNHHLRGRAHDIDVFQLAGEVARTG